MHDICRSILPGDLVFDVGANAGDKTAVFLSRGARVVAVEPQPVMVEGLRSRFEGNANVTIVAKGLAEVPGHRVMHINSQDTPISTFNPEWKEGRFKWPAPIRWPRFEVSASSVV